MAYLYVKVANKFKISIVSWIYVSSAAALHLQKILLPNLGYHTQHNHHLQAMILKCRHLPLANVKLIACSLRIQANYSLYLSIVFYLFVQIIQIRLHLTDSCR